MTQRRLTFLTVLVTASAFLIVSLANPRMWPHRFLLGIPFVFAVVCVFVGVLELEHGQLKRRVCSAPTDSPSVSTWLCVATMVWNLAALFLESSFNDFVLVLLSTAACLLTGFSLTRSGYQWLNQGPAFLLPASGDSQGKPPRTSTATTLTPLNAFGMTACLMAAIAVVRLAAALQRIVESQHGSWGTLFFVSELGDGRRGDKLTRALTSFALMMFAFFLNFLTHRRQYASASVRLAMYGCTVIVGIIGIGLWDLRSPLHFVFVALWSISAILASGSPVPTQRRLLQVVICKWFVRLAFMTYGVLTVGMLWSPDLRIPCIVAQRIAISALMLWFVRLWLIVAIDSLPHRRDYAPICAKGP